MGRRRVPSGLNARALPRFFVSPETLQSGVLPSDIAHQVRHVLRLGEGDAVCLLDGTGWVHFARLKSPTGHEVRFELTGRKRLHTELPLAISVLQALVRNEKAEQVVRFCTAAGASQILFAPAERSLVVWDEAKRQARQQRWQTIAREEAELTCRALCPRVAILPCWWTAIELLPHPRLLLDEWEGVRPLGEVWHTLPLAQIRGEQAEAFSLIVGPEGGFTQNERERMVHQHGCLPVSLGARVLRTELAAFYALAQIDAFLTCQTLRWRDEPAAD